MKTRRSQRQLEGILARLLKSTERPSSPKGRLDRPAGAPMTRTGAQAVLGRDFDGPDPESVPIFKPEWPKYKSEVRARLRATLREDTTDSVTCQLEGKLDPDMEDDWEDMDPDQKSRDMQTNGFDKYWYNHDTKKLHRIRVRDWSHHIEFAVKNPHLLRLSPEQKAANQEIFDGPTGLNAEPHPSVLKNNMRIGFDHDMTGNLYLTHHTADYKTLSHAHNVLMQMNVPPNTPVVHEFVGDKKFFQTTAHDTLMANSWAQISRGREKPFGEDVDTSFLEGVETDQWFDRVILKGGPKPRFDKYWYNHDTGKLHKLKDDEHHVQFAAKYPSKLKLSPEQQQKNQEKVARFGITEPPKELLANNTRILDFPKEHSGLCLHQSEPSSANLKHAQKILMQMPFLAQDHPVLHDFGNRYIRSTVQDTMFANSFDELKRHQAMRENVGKMKYSHSGWISPEGKVISGNHDQIARDLGFKSRKAPLQSGYVRFYISTNGEAGYQYKNRDSLNHIRNHIKNHSEHIKSLFVDGPSQRHDQLIQRWFQTKFMGESWGPDRFKGNDISHWYNIDTSQLHQLDPGEHHIDFAYREPHKLGLDHEQIRHLNKEYKSHLWAGPSEPPDSMLRNNLRIRSTTRHGETIHHIDHLSDSSKQLHHTQKALMMLDAGLKDKVVHNFSDEQYGYTGHIETDVESTLYANSFGKLGRMRVMDEGKSKSPFYVLWYKHPENGYQYKQTRLADFDEMPETHADWMGDAGLVGSSFDRALRGRFLVKPFKREVDEFVHHSHFTPLAVRDRVINDYNLHDYKHNKHRVDDRGMVIPESVLYHGTSASRVPQIQARGLETRPGEINRTTYEPVDPAVYLATDKDVARHYAQKTADHDGSKPAVLAVDLDKLPGHTFEPDEEHETYDGSPNPCVLTKAPVPPHAIQVAEAKRTLKFYRNVDEEGNQEGYSKTFPEHETHAGFVLPDKTVHWGNSSKKTRVIGIHGLLAPVHGFKRGNDGEDEALNAGFVRYIKDANKNVHINFDGLNDTAVRNAIHTAHALHDPAGKIYFDVKQGVKSGVGDKKTSGFVDDPFEFEKKIRTAARVVRWRQENEPEDPWDEHPVEPKFESVQKTFLWMYHPKTGVHSSDAAATDVHAHLHDQIPDAAPYDSYQRGKAVLRDGKLRAWTYQDSVPGLRRPNLDMGSVEKHLQKNYGKPVSWHHDAYDAVFEGIESKNQYIWLYHPKTGVHSSNTPGDLHVDLRDRIKDAPDYDQYHRGKGEIRDGKLTIFPVYSYSDDEDIVLRRPKLDTRAVEKHLSQKTGLPVEWHESSVFEDRRDSQILWAIHPRTGKVMTTQDHELHHEWFAEEGLPTAGPAFDRVQRGYLIKTRPGVGHLRSYSDDFGGFGKPPYEVVQHFTQRGYKQIYHEGAMDDIDQLLDEMLERGVISESDIVKKDEPSALAGATGRRDALKRLAGGVLANPISRAVATQAAGHAVTHAVTQGAQALAHAVKPKEVVPEFKGVQLLPHQAASAAHNAYNRDHGINAPTTEHDFDTETEKVSKPYQYHGSSQKVYGPEKVRSINPEGHPINTKAWSFEAEHLSGGTDKPEYSAKNRHNWKYSLIDKGDESDWSQHGHLLHAKVSNGTIAYENPFHERHRDSLETSVKAVHVNHDTGEVTKFKVPVDFDDHAASMAGRSGGIKHFGDIPDKWLRDTVTKHYNTRVGKGLNDFTVHKKVLTLRGFDVGMGNGRFSKEVTHKNWQAETGTGHQLGDEVSYHYGHPETGNKFYNARISQINPDGSLHVTKRFDTHGDEVTHHISADQVFNNLAFSDGKTTSKRVYPPNQFRKHLIVNFHDDGWNVTQRGSLHSDGPGSYHHTEPETLASGQSAEELRDFLNHHEKTWE